MAFSECKEISTCKPFRSKHCNTPPAFTAKVCSSIGSILFKMLEQILVFISAIIPLKTYVTEIYDTYVVRQTLGGNSQCKCVLPFNSLCPSLELTHQPHSCEVFAYRCEYIFVAHSINPSGVLCTPEFSINVVDRMNGYLCAQAFMFIHETQYLILKDLI